MASETVTSAMWALLEELDTNMTYATGEAGEALVARLSALVLAELPADLKN